MLIIWVESHRFRRPQCPHYLSPITCFFMISTYIWNSKQILGIFLEYCVKTRAIYLFFGRIWLLFDVFQCSCFRAFLLLNGWTFKQFDGSTKSVTPIFYFLILILVCFSFIMQILKNIWRVEHLPMNVLKLILRYFPSNIEV